MPFVQTSIWNQILAIATVDGGVLHHLGTAFLIEQNLALSATHVLTEALSRGGALAIQVVDGKPTPLMWELTHMYGTGSASPREDFLLDVAVVRLAPYGEKIADIESYRDSFLEMNVATPRKCDQLTAFGYAKSEFRALSAKQYALTHAFRQFECKVKDVFVPHRDLGMAPFPCFSVDANFEGGMSGGPIIDKYGFVRGVITAGGIEGTSLGSLLWPALAIYVQGKTLLTHCQDGTVRALNHHCVSIGQETNGLPPDIQFDPQKERIPLVSRLIS